VHGFLPDVQSIAARRPAPCTYALALEYWLQPRDTRLACGSVLLVGFLSHKSSPASGVLPHRHAPVMSETGSRRDLQGDRTRAAVANTWSLVLAQMWRALFCCSSRPGLRSTACWMTAPTARGELWNRHCTDRWRKCSHPARHQLENFFECMVKLTCGLLPKILELWACCFPQTCILPGIT
jgi:hypothetical protein